jgi:hypothetical protein
MSSASPLSVVGRAAGAACSLWAATSRFARRERAIFGQPEVGFGLIPGGGATERLPLMVGRSRAIEIVLGADAFDADTAEKYGWINRAIPEAELDDFVNGFVGRVLSFDGQALATAKQRLNQTFLPDPAQLQATGAAFVETLRSPQAVELMAKARGPRPQHGEPVRTRPRPHGRRTVGMSARREVRQHERHLSRAAVGDHAGRSAPSEPGGARGRGART